MRQEGDDVMLCHGLDLVDAGDVEFGRAALFPDGAGGFLGDHTEIGERVAGMGLDLEPDAELGFGGPDGDHFRPGVTRDHRARLSLDFTKIWPPLAKWGGKLNGCGGPSPRSRR